MLTRTAYCSGPGSQHGQIEVPQNAGQRDVDVPEAQSDTAPAGGEAEAREDAVEASNDGDGATKDIRVSGAEHEAPGDGEATEATGATS